MHVLHVSSTPSHYIIPQNSVDIHYSTLDGYFKDTLKKVFHESEKAATLQFLFHSSWQDFKNVVSKTQFDIIHFHMHGDRSGTLIFEEYGAPEPIFVSELASFLENTIQHRIVCILGACHSDLFTVNLLKVNAVSAVVSVSENVKIYEKDAIHFFNLFYADILQGHSLLKSVHQHNYITNNCIQITGDVGLKWDLPNGLVSITSNAQITNSPKSLYVQEKISTITSIIKNVSNDQTRTKSTIICLCGVSGTSRHIAFNYIKEYITCTKYESHTVFQSLDQYQPSNNAVIFDTYDTYVSKKIDHNEHVLYILESEIIPDDDTINVTIFMDRCDKTFSFDHFNQLETKEKTLIIYMSLIPKDVPMYIDMLYHTLPQICSKDVFDKLRNKCIILGNDCISLSEPVRYLMVSSNIKTRLRNRIEFLKDAIRFYDRALSDNPESNQHAMLRRIFELELYKEHMPANVDIKSDITNSVKRLVELNMDAYTLECLPLLEIVTAQKFGDYWIAFIHFVAHNNAKQQSSLIIHLKEAVGYMLKATKNDPTLISETLHIIIHYCIALQASGKSSWVLANYPKLQSKFCKQFEACSLLTICKQLMLEYDIKFQNKNCLGTLEQLSQQKNDLDVKSALMVSDFIIKRISVMSIEDDEKFILIERLVNNDILLYEFKGGLHEYKREWKQAYDNYMSAIELIHDKENEHKSIYERLTQCLSFIAFYMGDREASREYTTTSQFNNKISGNNMDKRNKYYTDIMDKLSQEPLLTLLAEFKQREQIMNDGLIHADTFMVPMILTIISQGLLDLSILRSALKHANEIFETDFNISLSYEHLKNRFIWSNESEMEYKAIKYDMKRLLNIKNDLSFEEQVCLATCLFYTGQPTQGKIIMDKCLIHYEENNNMNMKIYCQTFTAHYDHITGSFKQAEQRYNNIIDLCDQDIIDDIALISFVYRRVIRFYTYHLFQFDKMELYRQRGITILSKFSEATEEILLLSEKAMESPIELFRYKL